MSARSSTIINGTTLDIWEERDRLSIVLRNDNGSEFRDGPVIAAWWDDDARQMFTDGFFDAQDLHWSVYVYAKSVGLLPAKRSAVR